jgi:uncharacterized membrane protein
MLRVKTNHSLTPITDLVKSSLRIYFKKQNLIYLLKFVLVGFLIIVASIAPIAAITILSVSLFAAAGVSVTWPVILLGVLGILVIIAVVLTINLWLQIVQIEVLRQVTKDKILGIKKTLRFSWGKRIWPLFLAGLLYFSVVIVGFVLLLIPGIIFLVWFSFAFFIVVEERRGAVAALKRSKELVSDYFWPVLGRYLVFLLISAIVQVGASTVPVAGPIVVIFLHPYFMLLPYLLYQDLLRVKGSGERAR